jgi:phosphoenolpyruvate carboxylase
MTGYRAGRQGVETGNAPGSIQAALDGEETADILFELLANVVHRQHPEVAAVLRGKSEPGDFAPELLARVFQAHGIWFQLLAIVEQHTAMRLRRQTERVRGETAVQGTFASFIAEAANQGAAAQDLRDLFASTRIRPVITAHPTEAKRVTVLEKHRRIYRLLVEISPVIQSSAISSRNLSMMPARSHLGPAFFPRDAVRWRSRSFEEA